MSYQLANPMIVKCFLTNLSKSYPSYHVDLEKRDGPSLLCNMHVRMNEYNKISPADFTHDRHFDMCDKHR